MSGNKDYSKRRNKSNYYRKVQLGDSARKALEDINDDNETLKLFKEYNQTLADKQDRYEKIVKLNRDITIESKRVIFSLHNTEIDNENKRPIILNEAHTRLTALVETNFKQIAIELDKLDSYLYLRAYSNGLQEFIEAWTFYLYNKSNEIPSWVDLKKFLEYQIDNEEKPIALVVPYVDYVLGLADFTGELMRKCVNNLSAGKIEDCFVTCNLVKDILIGFLSVHAVGCKEVSRKLYVLKQSLNKMEFICYNIKVRGSEIPKHMLMDVINTNDNVDPEEDEGFF